MAEKQDWLIRAVESASDSIIGLEDKMLGVTPDYLSENQSSYSDADYRTQLKLRTAYAVFGLGMGTTAIIAGVNIPVQFACLVGDYFKYISNDETRKLADMCFHLANEVGSIFAAGVTGGLMIKSADRIKLFKKKTEEYAARHPSLQE